MILNKAKSSEERCLFSCTLGYLETQVQGKNMEFLVDSGSMVNVIPSSVALDLGLEVIKVEMGMSGISGQKCSIKGVVECCPITIGRFTGPVHLFVAPQAQECILGRPFLFDYDCTLDYQLEGEMLSFQGEKGRRVTVPLSKVGNSAMEHINSLGLERVKAQKSDLGEGCSSTTFKQNSAQSFL